MRQDRRDVRALVEQKLGSPVREAVSQGAGFTPGFASCLTGEDGRRVFVKAASKQAQRPIAASYAEVCANALRASARRVAADSSPEDRSSSSTAP